MNESRRPLYNALKYASSFPVIFLSAAQRTVITKIIDEQGEERELESWHGDALFRLWWANMVVSLVFVSYFGLLFRLLAAAINSLYSFWWDLTNDWGLELLASRLPRQPTLNGAISPPRPLVLPSLHSRSPSGSPQSVLMSSHLSSIPQPFTTTAPHNTHPSGLRSTLLYPLPFYPLIIFLNLILRLTWSIKLSSHLHSHSEGSVVIFWLEMAELVRRWLWVFVRVEWEVVKATSKSRSSQTTGNENGHGYEGEEYELQADPEDAGHDTG
jgi:EXS family